MSLETNTTNSIQNLDTNNPTNFDLINEGDDHIRMIKRVMKTTFPLINKPLTITSDDLNNIKSNLSTSGSSMTFGKSVIGTAGTTWDLKTASLENIATTTNYSKTNKDAVNVEALFKIAPFAVYPVGAVYISAVAGNPKDLLGMTGTTWEQIGQGRVLCGVGTNTDAENNTLTVNLNDRGGLYKVGLSGSDMPRHGHSLSNIPVTIDAAGNHNHMIVGDDGLGSWLRTTGGGIDYDARSHGGNGHWYLTSDAGNHSHGARIASGNTSVEGGTSRHENMVPYLGVFMWKRVA